ncbi:glycoside hydrolase family 97 protein [Pseudoalteromonas aliena]|uniref:glycoside hydrolase family 97 protein n=1 Tax=Pseudoalteromonas aliena TaxID=247523 RepID=UPI002494733B|nr:glycoside hydrolase family 97 protein [Pseudoalteromonas aliena]
MKKLFFLVFLTAIISCRVDAVNKTITSPSGEIELTINTDRIDLEYSIKVSEELIFEDAKANIMFEKDGLLLRKNKFKSMTTQYVDKVVTPHIKQKSATIRDNYNQLNLEYTTGIIVQFRVFNNGVAYRFVSDKRGESKVVSETAEFKFTRDFLTYYPQEKSFYSHNERTYLNKNLSELSDENLGSLPLLVDGSKFKVVITETGLRNFPGLWVTGNGKTSLIGTHPKRVLSSSLKDGSDRNETIIKRAEDIALISASESDFKFPWRVIAISQDDKELLNNQLSYLLAQESEIDPTWVKPGKVAWDWWNANNLYGVDFKAGVNTETYKYYIDFAAQYGLEYIILDEGWYTLGNALEIVDDIDVQEIVSYGESKNIGVILWVVWETLGKDMDNILKHYQKWGVKGIKVDFMQRDDQEMVNYYWKVAKAAADAKLLVNFHGSYKPAGLRRAYPNVITREGVRGLEHNKWGDYITSEHNLTLPFIRMLAGPMDYTPGAMVNTQPENFRISFNRPMSKTTRAHQVALYVVFESPLQMLADSPSNYRKEHESTRFISSIPSVWDETVVLSAKLTDHIVMARRSGSDWFVAVLGNSEGREYEIDFGFLGQGQYKMELFKDGINADNYASDYATSTLAIDSKLKHKVQLAPNGGWVAKLRKVAN